MNPYREPGLTVEAAPKPEYTIESLMKLIAELTGHGYEGSRVTMGYMRMRVHTAQDESHLDENQWGWTASTTLLGETSYDGKSVGVSAQGVDQLIALKNLARQIVTQQMAISSRRREAVDKAYKRLIDAGLMP